MTAKAKVIEASWPVPKHVRAFTTTRQGGVSEQPYSGFNLGAHVGDSADFVAKNRAKLVEQFSIPNPIVWLNQTHSTSVAVLPNDIPHEADASVASSPVQVCAVLTADCLPVVLTNVSGTRVAVVHAGWRGLCQGVIEETLSQFSQEEQVIAWLGPAIGPNAFEVGEEVRVAFIQKMQSAERAFKPSINAGKWFGNLYELAKQRLNTCGVFDVYGGDHCTFSEEDLFYSYRRDGVTGRMATLVWMER
ncbi:peptidoglycan editing factor PgeF [Marinomonas mediterranea]|jgi:uncharacterized protein, YfiH family|uniref:Purine nucleoside phosphorylase n=1 Tax=Marinomonas mediterranea (strain ATCC 700492 / JCM 21426 / NBRC 103028 / MMB-1) TaxID=717774 RepID=F2K1G6_MARM1|nr:peptidoglycan editing factor PgeF [Marinomonas mediterranea]ADZ92196.1 Multi-copper polyphenol oxidoreductase, laccase [Marinomonas mediterranea MMB-1]WCN18258.1 peptidoglycan editing factor PgeF [Marinomonas mediterranea MMB-1]